MQVITLDIYLELQLEARSSNPRAGFSGNNGMGRDYGLGIKAYGFLKNCVQPFYIEAAVESGL